MVTTFGLDGKAGPSTKGALNSAAAPAAPAWPGKLAKRIAKREALTAAAYWGGSLRVTDASGAVKTQQKFAQDIADVSWIEGTLVVGLADGRILGLEFK